MSIRYRRYATKLEISEEGLELITNFLGFFPVAYKLKETGDYAIGYGTKTYSDGTKVVEGDGIQEGAAREQLLLELGGIVVAIQGLVSAQIFNNEFEALVSFVHDIGVEEFQKSEVLKLINGNQHELAANQLLQWDRDDEGRIDSKKQTRRLKEREYFLQL